ncbi:glycosyltransferase family 2 protein [Acinetobacter baylyi]|uniref:glycosyltransferase family 2 protein n=1 Tax=Acinetobacter baylyi TaxID=202950 RepID=UPI0031E172C4
MSISVVIVSYQPCHLKIQKMVEILLNHESLSVILVDNGSCDIDILISALKNKKNFYSLVLSENLGIAYAQNIGITKSIELNSDYIIFFDQDSSLDNNFINNLISDYNYLRNKDYKIAAVGPRFLDENKGFYFPALKFNKNGLIDKISVENINEPIEVSFLISSGTLVPVDALKKIGLMREEFFIDFVDTEWCFRALSKGYKLYMSEKAVMKHSIGDDTLKIANFNIPVHSGFRRYYRIRNLFFMWKMPYIPKILVAKLMISNFAIQVLLFLIKSNKMDYIKYYIKAIKDGLKQSKNYQA